MTQSTVATVAALHAVCQGIYADQADGLGQPVGVFYGLPGSYLPAYFVAVGSDMRQPITRPTMGTNRSREQLAEIDIECWTYVAGGDAAQQAASEAAYGLSSLLEAWFRTAPHEALSGACMDAWVSNIDGPSPLVATDPQSGNVVGRHAKITITVTARIRY